MNAGIYHKNPLPYCNYSKEPESQAGSYFVLTNDIGHSQLLVSLPANLQYGQYRGTQLLSHHSRRTLGEFLRMPEVLQGGCADYNPDVVLSTQYTEPYPLLRDTYDRFYKVGDFGNGRFSPIRNHNTFGKAHELRLVGRDDILPLAMNHHHHSVSKCYSSKHIDRVLCEVYRDDILPVGGLVYCS